MMCFSFKWDMYGHWTVRIDPETISCEARCLGYRRVMQCFRNELDKVLVGHVPPGCRVSNETVPGEGRRLIFRFKNGIVFAMPLSQTVKMSQEHCNGLLRRINRFLISK